MNTALSSSECVASSILDWFVGYRVFVISREFVQNTLGS